MAVPFALNPAAAVNGIIDFTTSEGRKLYSKATEKLQEELYDCSPEGMFAFIRAYEDRASMYGWNDENAGINMIPNNAENPFEEGMINLINNYGEVSLEMIQNFDATYINTPTRAAQDLNMMYQCLMNSLSTEGKRKVLVWREQYMIGSMHSGNLLLKVIVRESHLDTNATAATIRMKLSSLDKYIQTIGSDIIKFNQYVMLLTDRLSSRGQTSTDLLTNLFLGYSAASDKTFVDYIGRKQESYEDGNEITPQELMEMAANKYKNLKLLNRWNAPTPEEEKIIALEAKLKNLKKTRKVKFKPDAQESDAKENVPKRRKKELPDWVEKRPPEDKLFQPKTWNGKQWWYCHPDTGGNCHGIYRCSHKPKDCKKKPQKGSKGDEKGKQEGPKKLKLTKALEAITKQDSDSSE